MRSWNWPWMSPQTVTGLLTGCTFDSSIRISFTCKHLHLLVISTSARLRQQLYNQPLIKENLNIQHWLNYLRIDTFIVIKKERKIPKASKGEDGARTYSQRSWSSSSERCWPSLTFEIHWSKSIALPLISPLAFDFDGDFFFWGRKIEIKIDSPEILRLR